MRKILCTALLAIAPLSSAFAAECAVAIAANDQMQFDKKSIAVPKSCKTFKVTLTHTGKLPKTAMGHNWVLAETTAVQGIAGDGITAGAANNYVKPGDARVIAATKIVGGGEQDAVSFSVAKLRAGTDYSFFCSFPGHPAVMKGALTLTN